MQMRKPALFHICLVALVGILVAASSIYELVLSLKVSTQLGSDVSYLIIMTFMCFVCSCLPIVMSNRQTVDMSYVCILSTLLMKGRFFAVTIALVSMIFVVSKQVVREKDGSLVKIRYAHILNTPIEQTLFNMGNLAISIYFPGWVFEQLYSKTFGCEIGTMIMPQLLVPTFVFLLLTLLTNYTLLVLLFVFNKSMKLSDVFAATFGEILPNLCSIAPIGLLFAYILTINNGQYLALLFIFPLILARYSFNLYLDSKNQYYKMVKVMIVTLEAKDEYTKGHSQRVEKYVEEICEAFKLNLTRTDAVKMAALLHDIGKIGIEEHILRKPAGLSDDEFKVISTHPEIGVKMLQEINVPQHIITYVKYHHKRYDGGGYPALAEGDEVPLEAFILSVADSYDAMTSDRPYRKGFPVAKALDIISENSGTQFHPEVARVFIDMKRAQLAASLEQEAAEAKQPAAPQ